MKNKSLDDFWLNKNGTYTPKTSWVRRAIRWIQNWLYDKTLNDIWHVFKKTIADYDFSHGFPMGDLEDDDQRDSLQFINERRERLDFVISFLLSRKDKFDYWVRKDKEKQKTLQSYIKKYQDSSAAASGENPQNHLMGNVLQRLEKLYVPKLNPKALGKKPPSITPAITLDKKDKKYRETNIEELPNFLERVALENSGIHTKAQLVKSLKELCSKVSSRDSTIPGINTPIRSVFYDHLEMLLKNILYEIQNNCEISKEKKDQALIELAIGSMQCPPRWLEEMKRQYQSLMLKNMHMGEDKALGYVQELKEDIISDKVRRLYVTSDGDELEFHFLNTFRKKFGEEFGLDTSTCGLDVYAYPATPEIYQSMKLSFLKSFKAP
ncbi:MAG: DUF1539 domain-containing protein, partial [bacterium]